MTLQAFTLTYAGTGFADHVDERRVELVQRISAKVGGRWAAAWDTRGDRVRFTRRLDLPPLVPHPGIDPDLPWHVLPFADGGAFDLLVTSHLLIVGATNAGKSVLIRSLVVAAAAKDCEVYLADPKRVTFVGYRGWPGIKQVASKDEDLHQVALDFNAEVQRRYDLYEDEGVPLESHRPAILVIDEYEEFASRMKGYARREKIKVAGEDSPAQEAMASTLRLAREARMHVVIGTQRPDASWFGGAARDNVQGRAFVGRATGEAARMLFGRSDVARDVPPAAKGRTTVQTFDEEPREVQAWWTPKPDSAVPADQEILDRLRPA